MSGATYLDMVLTADLAGEMRGPIMLLSCSVYGPYSVTETDTHGCRKLGKKYIRRLEKMTWSVKLTCRSLNSVDLPIIVLVDMHKSMTCAQTCWQTEENTITGGRNHFQEDVSGFHFNPS